MQKSSQYFHELKHGNELRLCLIELRLCLIQMRLCLIKLRLCLIELRLCLIELTNIVDTALEKSNIVLLKDAATIKL